NMTLVNYAFGGATSSNDDSPSNDANGGSQSVPSVLDQMDAFLSNNTHIKDKEDDLVAIEVGSNNIFHLLNNETPTGLTNITEKLQETSDNLVSDIEHALEKMADAGYTNYLVWLLPPLYRTSLFASAPDVVKTTVSSIVNSTNSATISALDSYKNANPDKVKSLNYFDIDAFATFILNEPAILAALNITDTNATAIGACGSADTNNATQPCPEGYTHFYVDGIHPSARVQFLAGIACNEIINNNFELDVNYIISLIKKYNIGQATADNNILADNHIKNDGDYVEGNDNNSSGISDDDDDDDDDGDYGSSSDAARILAMGGSAGIPVMIASLAFTIFSASTA
ncbi:hypothetical protein EV182_003946, partial [Spiromyces aspiralis]